MDLNMGNQRGCARIPILAYGTRFSRQAVKQLPWTFPPAVTKLCQEHLTSDKNLVAIRWFSWIRNHTYCPLNTRTSFPNLSLNSLGMKGLFNHSNISIFSLTLRRQQVSVKKKKKKRRGMYFNPNPIIYLQLNKAT